MQLFVNWQKEHPGGLCVDLTTADPLLRAWHDNPRYANKLILPASPMLIGFRTSERADSAFPFANDLYEVNCGEIIEISFELSEDKPETEELADYCPPIYGLTYLKLSNQRGVGRFDPPFVLNYPKPIEPVAGTSPESSRGFNLMVGKWFEPVLSALSLLALGEVRLADRSFSLSPKKHRQRSFPYKILAAKEE